MVKRLSSADLTECFSQNPMDKQLQEILGQEGYDKVSGWIKNAGQVAYDIECPSLREMPSIEVGQEAPLDAFSQDFQVHVSGLSWL